MKPNILVCGKTGAGKTSLIQAVTHAGTVPDGPGSDPGHFPGVSSSCFRMV